MAIDDNFVGRRFEIEDLQAAYADAMAGSGQVMLLAGEPGIGKTRTAIEFASRVGDSDTSVVWGRCQEEVGAPPYWPWTQILSSVIAAQGVAELKAALGTGASDIADVLPDIRSRFPDIERPPVSNDPAGARFRLFSSIARLLIETSQHKVNVVVLDDLHWADAPSLHLLEFVAQAMVSSRLLIVGTYRETELSRRHRLTDTLGALARLAHVRRRHMAGLEGQDVLQFMTTTIGFAPPAWLASAVHEQTDGNPLFVREVVRFLHEQGYFAKVDRSTAKPTTIRLPEGLRDVIGRRLNRLSANCNDVLALAAVIGREFTIDVLVQASRARAEGEVTEALDEAMTAHLVEETEPGRLQFTHALVRITLYDELRIGQRQRFHHAVGQAIEFVHRRDLEPVLSDLAHHYRAANLAGDAEKAIDFATRAGRRADSAFAFEDAVTFYQNALDMLDALETDDVEQRYELLMLLGHGHRKVSDYVAALEALSAAAGLGRRLDRPAALAEAAIVYADTAWRSDMQINSQSAALLNEALARMPATEFAPRSKLLGMLARDRLHTGSVEEARIIAAQAISLARQTEDPMALAQSLASLSDLPWNPRETERMLEEADEIVSVGHRARDYEVVLRGQFRRAALLLELGNIAAAVVAIDEMGSTNTHIRQPMGIMFELTIRATLALLAGDLKEAESRIIQSLNFARKSSHTMEPLSVLIFTLRREQGRLKQFGPLARSLVSRKAGGTIWPPGLALLCIEIDDHTRAREILNELARDSFAALPNDGRLSASLVYLSEVCCELGNEATAASLYRMLQPWEGRNMVMGGGTGFWGSSGRYLGQLAGTTGDWHNAERHFSDALAMNEKVGARAQLAHTYHDLALLLLKRGWSGDARTAAMHLEAGARLADELGLASLAEKVAARRQKVGPHVTNFIGPDNLTSRELEVLRLLAIGRTNADIATALGISQSTVASHVHNILSKTGCDNRTEAAAYAARHGLGVDRGGSR